MPGSTDGVSLEVICSTSYNGGTLNQEPGELVLAEDPQPYVTLFLKIWAPIGPLVGIWVGHYLSQRSQGKQRDLDKVENETREVMTAFNALVPAFTMWARTTRFRPPLFSDVESHWQELTTLETAYREKSVAFYSILRDRIVISEHVTKLEIRKKWEAAMTAYQTTFDEAALEKQIEAINKDLVVLTRNKKIK